MCVCVFIYVPKHTRTQIEIEHLLYEQIMTISFDI